MPWPVSRVIAIKSPEDFMLTNEELVRLFLVDPGSFSSSGNAIRWSASQPVGVWYEVDVDTAGTQPFICYSDSPLESSLNITVREHPEIGRNQEIVTISGTATATTSLQYKRPFVSKGQSVGTITVRSNDNSSIPYSEYYPERDAVSGTEMFYPKVTLSQSQSHIDHIRVKMHPRPTETTIFKVIFKSRMVPLDNDSDSPQIEGIEDCLIAHGMADMLEKLRQFSKAAEKRKEAAFQLNKMQKMETDQQAYISRITPAIYDSPEIEDNRI